MSGVYARDKGEWYRVDGGSAGLPGLGGWATITDVKGKGKKYSYTDAAGDWIAYEWTADGELTTSGGLVETLIVTSGSSSGATYSHGGGVFKGLVMSPSDTGNITVGQAVSGYSSGTFSGIEFPIQHVRIGGSSSDVRTPNANGYMGHYDNGTQSNSRGAGANGDAAVNTPGPGVTSSIKNNIPVEYGRGGAPGAVPANTGQGNGALNGPSSAGVVIIRVPKANDLFKDIEGSVTGQDFDISTTRKTIVQALEEKAKEKIKRNRKR